jgi:hypothetical protein
MTTSTTSPPKGPGIGGQALLKRRTGTSPQEFRDHYINRHAPIAIPWCLANGVTYYAQVRASKSRTRFRSSSENRLHYQIHRPLRWSTPDLESRYKALGIELDDWDAVAEMVFPPVVTIDDYYRAKTGKAYHLAVILPDERRFLLDEALKSLQGVEPGAVVGDRVKLIVDGRAAVNVGKWQGVFDKFHAGTVS